MRPSGRAGLLRRLFAWAGILGAGFLVTTATQDANANGETRTLTMVHAHTHETLSITFKRDGAFDSDALKKLNWFLRDWRIEEPISMAPQLFDVIWYVYREVGATEPIRIMSAYRSPGTNAMLRRRSRAVAKESQHMRGNAMDIHIPGVSMAQVREIGMRLQRGGVGYYPSAGSPFVHLDVGSVRSWPRMPRPQLERLFPDGKTVHLPADGIPLANYQAALAEVQSRGGSALDYGTVTSNRGKSLWALLFGGDEDDDTREALGRGRNTRVARGRGAAPPQEVASANFGDSVNAWGASRPVAGPAPTEVRPTPQTTSPVAVASLRVPAASATSPSPAPPVIPGAAALEIASLPVPPIRPRGARFESLVASFEPVPPIRPGNLDTLVAALPQAGAAPVAAPVPTALAFAPGEGLALAPGIPLPPARPQAIAALAPSPRAAEAGSAVAPGAAEFQPVDLPGPPARPASTDTTRTVAGLPGILARPAEETPLARAYAAISAPQPPSRPVTGRPATGATLAPHTTPGAVPPATAALAESRATAPTVRRTNPVALVGARPAAVTRPLQVIAVAEPPVAREIRRGVLAMSFSQGPAQGGSGSGGFGGSFIRPMGPSFSRPGE
jgi:uncharacterized protein YcbK (DUF882 family)